MEMNVLCYFYVLLCFGYIFVINKCLLLVLGYVVVIVNFEFDFGNKFMNFMKGNDCGMYFFNDI